jgi:hypothetical protein
MLHRELKKGSVELMILPVLESHRSRVHVIPGAGRSFTDTDRLSQWNTSSLRPSSRARRALPHMALYSKGADSAGLRDVPILRFLEPGRAV